MTFKRQIEHIKFKMKNKTYKIIFFVYNLLGILNLKFDGKKFKFSKILFYKTLIIFVILTTKKFFDQYSIFYKHKIGSISLFSRTYIELNEQFQIHIIIIMAWIHLQRQKEIADIFTNFCNLKRFCDENKFKINLKKLKFKINVYLVVVFLLFSFVFIDLIFHDPNLKWSKVINKFLTAIVSLYFISLFVFIYFILIHFNFLLINVNEILENRLSDIHNDCQNLLNNLKLIQELFELLKNSFQMTLFLFAIFQLSIISKIVNIALKINNFLQFS